MHDCPTPSTRPTAASSSTTASSSAVAPDDDDDDDDDDDARLSDQIRTVRSRFRDSLGDVWSAVGVCVLYLM